MKLYIAVLDKVPDYIVPTLVAHTMLGAHLQFFVTDSETCQWMYPDYNKWLSFSFKKCVIKVNQKEFDKIAKLPSCYKGYEKYTLDGIDSCVIPVPVENKDLPNVLKYAKLWKPSME